MSNPNFRDPRLDPPPLREEEIRSKRLNELSSSNAMWGWVAGVVVLALVLIFVFTRGQVSDTTASHTSPTPQAATTGMAPPNPASPAAPAPSTTPSAATGQTNK